MSSFLFSNVMEALGKGLDVAALRQRVIADNIANVDTPGYKRSRVWFSAELADAMSRAPVLPLATTSPRHTARTAGSGVFSFGVEKVGDTSYRQDGNNVDIEAEMAELAENSVLYTALARQVEARLGMLRTAIYEGRR